MSMVINPKQSKGRDSALLALDVAIEGLNPAKEISTIVPARAVFSSASVLLPMIRVRPSRYPAATRFRFTLSQDSMANELDYIELGLSCAEVCETLDQGLKGRQLDELDQPVLGAIGQLAGYVGVSMRMLGGPLTGVTIAELWPRSRRRSSRSANVVRFLDSCTRRMTRRRSPLGGRTSKESFASLT